MKTIIVSLILLATGLGIPAFAAEWPILTAKDWERMNTLELSRLLSNESVQGTSPEGRTALMQAAAYSTNPVIIDLLIDRGAKPNATDDYGTTPLILAAGNDSLQVAEALIRRGAINDRRSKTGNALDAAAPSASSPEILRLLVRSGVPVPHSAVTAAAKHNPRLNVLRFLISAYKQQTGNEVDFYRLLLLGATSRQEMPIVRFLMSQGIDVDSQAFKEMGLFEWAVEYGRVETVELFVNLGAEVNAVRSSHGSPLMVSARNSLEVTEFLLKAGADPNYYAERGPTPLVYHCQEGTLDHVDALIAAGAEVNPSDNNLHSTPLAAAIRYRRHDIAEFLIRKEADLEARDPNGQTALMVAARYHDAKGVSILLEAGARVNSIDALGQTPLLNALSTAHGTGERSYPSLPDVIEYLLASGADPHARTRDGRTPDEVLAKNRYLRMSREYDEVMRMLQMAAE